MMVVPVVPVAPIVVAVPAPVARKFEVAPGIARRVAMAAEAFDHTIKVPFGVLDTFVAAAAPVPRLSLSRHTAHQQKRGKTDAPK